MSKEDIESVRDDAAPEKAQGTDGEAGRAGDDGSSGEDAIAKLQGDLDKFRDLALRSQADLDNFRKRSAREREDSVKFANAALLERLLPVIDNFTLGLESAAGDDSEGTKAIHDGLQMVLRQLCDVLAEFGVAEVPSTGEEFDPNLHEAVSQQPSDEVPEGHVVKELRKGYLFKDRLLRASTVVVSSGAEA